MTEPRRPAIQRALLLLLLAAIPLSVLTVYPDWLSRLAYAVEVGQARASQQQLSTATDLSQAFQHVAKSVKPSVVSIRSVRRMAVRQPQMRPFGPQVPDEFRGFFDDEMFERFFEDRLPDREFERRGMGSGVVISADGYIVTNNHVVGQADEVKVTLSDGREFTAEIVGTDRSTDLAVLKIDADNLQPATLGSSDELEVGEWVLAMGSPFGLEQTVTAGIISAKSRANMGITDYEDFIQTDAAINPGNSGGPLVNLRGEVVGINTAIASRSGGYMGVGFAIPSDMTRAIVDSLITEGSVTRGWLGAMIQDLDDDLARSFGYDATDGVLIGDVMPDSPAQQAGLQSGDIVTSFDGQPVTSANQLRNLVAQAKPGEEVQASVFRDGEELSVTVTIAKRDDQTLQAAIGDRSTSGLGMTVQTLTNQQARELGLPGEAAGVVVTEVEPGSLAHRAMIRPQDVIVSVGGREVRTAREFREAVADLDLQQGIRLQVFRDGFRRFVYLRGGE